MPVPAGPESGISLADVKAALDKTLTVDDDEILRMISAAEAEYADYVGPVETSVTETVDGCSRRLILKTDRASALTSVVGWDGTVFAVDDLTLDNGMITWGYGTTGYFTSQRVIVSYTVAAIPAHHMEAIIADIAGYFEATQRGPVGLPGEGYDAAFRSSPLRLFPRIRALAVPGVA